jgi:hypothetical protein
MRLSEKQLDIIKGVRVWMEKDGYPPRYICHAIASVLVAREKEGSLSEAESSTLKHTLSAAILAGISHMVTFGAFMLMTCDVFNTVYDRDAGEFSELVHLARLAWLDWIIETGEIKPDLIAGDER